MAARSGRGDTVTGGALDARVVVGRRAGFRLDVTVAAAPGETVAVMGPSGAGKSTLVSAIAGLVRLDDGRIAIDEKDVSRAKPRRHVPPALRNVVLLGQEPRLFPHLTARENVAFGPRARGVDKEVARRDADDWLWRVGLPGSGPHRPAELSGGQQQRVALARALATSPKVLLLDEPFTALDAETAGDLRALLHEQLHATRSTTLIVTHDAVDAAALASRLVIVENGAVTQEGAVAEVLAMPATRFAAAVAGTNRLVGVARRGGWSSGDGEADVVLDAADIQSRAAAHAEGAALAALVRPGAVHLEPVVETSWTGALRLARDTAPERGSWLARVVRLEQTPGGVRVHTADPVVAVDLPADAAAAQGLVAGMPVRLWVDPADVRFARIP
ncbi:MAG: ATP-binding cassette domain-containing protein [Microbacterium sp.]|uniref:sulfate/molybdate ABC transporter ATP-binding protein n=1 Tax=Microbacterium sp. TaxID=51671 RepID=UPI0039E536B4